MEEQARLDKNRRIAESMAATRGKRLAQRPLVVELKLDLKCLNKAERSRLMFFFVQCRWLCNYLISLMKKGLFDSFDTKTRDITSLDKDGNPVERHLDMPAKFIQSVKQSLIANMKALAAKRKKTGKANGELKFRSEYNCIDLNQYGNTHWVCYGDDGDKNGKYRNTVHIVGIKRPIRVFGMEQIPENAEFANAKLVKRPSGIYLMLTCYVPASSTSFVEKRPPLGLDFGIKTTITTSDGEKYDISIGESDRLKGLQKKLARQIKGSRGWYETRVRIRREYERIANQRRDKANKVYHEVCKGREFVAIQDENLRGWAKGLFGRQVQYSALGTIKSKIKNSPNAIVLDRFFPSTKLCPVCGHMHNGITLADRVYTCPSCGYSEDRDTKAALVILQAARLQASSPPSCGTQAVLWWRGCQSPDAQVATGAFLSEARSSSAEGNFCAVE